MRRFMKREYRREEVVEERDSLIAERAQKAAQRVQIAAVIPKKSISDGLIEDVTNAGVQPEVAGDPEEGTPSEG